MRRIKTLIKNDLKNYVFSKEFLFFAVIFPSIIILLSVNITASSEKGTIDVSINDGPYFSTASSILSDMGYSVVSTNPDVVINITSSGGKTIIKATGIVRFNEKNPDFRKIEGDVQTLAMRMGNVPDIEYYALVKQNGELFEEPASEIVNVLNSMLMITTLFVFFLVFMGIGTIISSVVEDKRSRFLDVYLASPAKKQEYIFAKTVSTIITAGVIIVVYSIIMMISLVAIPASNIPGAQPQASAVTIAPENIVPMTGIVVSFLLAGFSMMFLLFIAISVVFVIDDYNKAVTVSTAVVDALAIPGLLIAMSGKILNVIAMPWGKLTLTLNPATSPVMVIFGYMTGNMLIVTEAILITIVLTVIAGIFAIKTLKV